jgi:hypothetical protein
VLVTMMLVTGVCNTLLTKYQVSKQIENAGQRFVFYLSNLLPARTCNV